MRQYSSATLKYFQQPLCVGVFPSEMQHVHQAEVGLASEGERIRLQLHIEQHKIIEARFKAYGNPYVIAASAYLCEQLQGKTLTEARNMNYCDWVAALTIPKTHHHSALLVEEVLMAALISGERS